ncbi:hypothetical protein KSP39_PZI020776 [Platanthera zijinensis]|uniref:Chromo domain-containing protein n=1 Tax=Platanthera zijinensis TaxID=2320716 RepID=A0AAP0B0C0_9ASPA
MTIVPTREILRQGKEIQQRLVQWEGLPPEDSTWEDLSSLDDLSSLQPQAVNEEGTSWKTRGQRRIQATHGKRVGAAAAPVVATIRF